jgi:F-type H+-transporting ATPase subunit b|tara:strand:+ start:4706 stop:5188 length:483 start_codon:yes stop_codon:yes gene_type:complete
MLASEYTWIILALVIFLALALWKGLRPTLNALDARGDRIRKELEEAHSLRQEAQKYLADSKRRQRDAIKEAEEILAHAKDEAERLSLHAEEDIKASLARREQLALDKIAQAEATALMEVRSKSVDAAIQAAEALISGSLTEKKAGDLTDSSIKEVAAHLN